MEINLGSGKEHRVIDLANMVLIPICDHLDEEDV